MNDEKISVHDDDFLLSQGTVIFNDSQSTREMIQQSWADEMDLYNNEFSKDENKYSAYLGTKKLFIPKTYTNTQRIVVECLDTFFFDSDEIVSVSSDKSIPKESQDAVKSLINYRLNGHPVSFFHEAYEACLDAVRNKVGIFKVYPQLKVKKQKKTQVITSPSGQPVEVSYDEEVIESYSPKLEAIPPEDLYFSQSSTWKNYWQYPIVHRYKKSRDQLKRMGYKNVDEVSQIQNELLSDQLKMKRDQPLNQSPFQKQTKIAAQQEVMVYEFWDFLPYDGKLESCSYILLGDEASPSVVGRGWELNELPYKFDDFEYNRPPFLVGPAYPEAHQLYGKSYPIITQSLQMETNAQRNQEREAVARALRPHVYVNRDADVDLMALVNRRIGGYVQGSGPASDSITELPSMNPMAITAGHQARTDNDYYETGIPPNLLGAGSADDTATGASQNLMNANKKISIILKSLANSLFIPAFNYLLRLEQVYCSDDFINMVTGKTLGWKLPNDEFPARNLIQGDFDFKMNLGINKQGQINKWLMILDRANQSNQVTMAMVQSGVVPPQSATFFNSTWMYEQMFNMLGIKNPDDYKMAAQQPPQGQESKGVASQARNPGDPSQQVSQGSPEPTGVMNVI